jgi:hypothetical protein
MRSSWGGFPAIEAWRQGFKFTWSYSKVKVGLKIDVSHTTWKVKGVVESEIITKESL